MHHQKLIKNSITLILSLIIFLCSFNFLIYSFSWWTEPEPIVDSIFRFVTPVCIVATIIRFLYLKKRRFAHIGLFICGYISCWLLLWLVVSVVDFKNDYAKNHHPTVTAIREKDPSPIQHLNLRGTFYAHDNISVTFYPNDAYDETDISTLIDWLPASSKPYEIYLDYIPNTFKNHLTKFTLSPDKTLTYCYSDDEDMCEKLMEN